MIVNPKESGLDRSIRGIVTHADGTIFLNTKIQQTLSKSTDQGKRWTLLLVNLPAASLDPVQHGLFVSRGARL